MTSIAIDRFLKRCLLKWLDFYCSSGGGGGVFDLCCWFFDQCLKREQGGLRILTLYKADTVWKAEPLARLPPVEGQMQW